ncbi:MAG TPA: hypothetical protein VGJ05_10080, partial [Fimbriiglobus sp.]
MTNSELETDQGKELLELVIRITSDGRLDLPELKELRKWLITNKENVSIAAIGYLRDIMNRITADKVIDQDELLELHLALERVVPNAYRTPIIQARKKREAARRERLREMRRIERVKEQEQLQRIRKEEYA